MMKILEWVYYLMKKTTDNMFIISKSDYNSHAESNFVNLLNQFVLILYNFMYLGKQHAILTVFFNLFI
jgi:hypothetical protein